MIPPISDKLRKQGRNAYKAGEYEEAAAYYRRLLSGRSGDPPADALEVRDHRELGIALLRCGRHAESARELEIVVVAEPDNASAFRKLGAACLGIGKPQRALEAFRAAAKLEPTEASYQWSYAEVAIALGERKDAEEALDASLALDPDNLEAKAAKAALEAQAPSAFGGPDARPLSDSGFEDVLDFVRNRPGDDPPPPRPKDMTFRPFVYTVLGALGFLGSYLYVRVIMIG